MSTSVNFSIKQGDTFEVTAFYKDSLGDPVPLTGYTASSQVRDDFGGKVLCASASLGDGIVIDEELGSVTLTYTPAKTKKFTVPRAAVQLKIVSPLGKTTTLIYSYISVSKAAIQDA